MKPTVLACTAILLCAAISFAVSAEKSNPGESLGTDVNPLAEQLVGNTIWVEIDESTSVEKDSDTMNFTDASIERIGDRYFIVGKGYKGSDADGGWYHDTVIGFPWERVLRFQIMTPEQFETRNAQFEHDYMDAE